MGSVQIFLYKQKLDEWFYATKVGLELAEASRYSFEWTIEHSIGQRVFGIAFVIVTLFLVWNGTNQGSRSHYTLQRLQVSEKGIFMMQSIYNGLCYVLLLGVQLLIFLVQYSMYANRTKDITNQTLFLAFYRNDFMYSVFPLEGGLRWTMNILIIVSCGVSAAVFTYLQRRGKIAWSLFVVVACIGLGFVQEIGEMLIIVTALLTSCIAGITAYWHVFKKQEVE